jgi:hypothetical protein
VWFLSRVLCNVHSKDHAVTALSSRTTHRETITRSALHHYQGRNYVADSVKLAAIRDALDRAGLAAKNAVKVEVGPPKPYEVILESIQAGSRAEYRGSIGRPDDFDAEYNRALLESRE